MMRLHWFSPLPPDRTDIGHFTNRVLPALKGRAEVTVWTQTTHPRLDPSLSFDVRPLRIDDCAIAELNRADAVFYNFGNHGVFHAAILEAAWRVPGIAIVHEADLQGLFAHYWVEQKRNGPLYVAQMAKLYGDEGEQLARARLRGEVLGEDLARLPILKPAVRNALAVLCHTEAVEAAALSFDLPVVRAPLPYAASPSARPSRREGPIRLLQFGYLGPHRRIETVLSALARQSDRGAVRLDIYGQLWDPGHIASMIARLGLQDVVRLHGFVSDEALDAAVEQADLVFNLRYPTVGEASGSQLRIWNGAAPSLVTRVGWFADLPDETVLKIDLEREDEQIDAALLKLRAERTCFDELGRAGRAHLLAVHDTRSYGDTLLACARNMPEFRRRAGASALARRLRPHSPRWLPPFAADLAAAAIQRRLSRMPPA